MDWWGCILYIICSPQASAEIGSTYRFILPNSELLDSPTHFKWLSRNSLLLATDWYWGAGVGSPLCGAGDDARSRAGSSRELATTRQRHLGQTALPPPHQNNDFHVFSVQEMRCMCTHGTWWDVSQAPCIWSWNYSLNQSSKLFTKHLCCDQRTTWVDMGHVLCSAMKKNVNVL